MRYSSRSEMVGSLLLFALPGVVVLGVLLWFFGPMNTLGATISLVRPWLLTVILPVVVIGGVGAGFYFRQDTVPSVLASTVTGTLVTAWIVAVGVLFTYGYDRAYAEKATVVQGTPTYAERAPFVLAEEIASRDMQNVVGDRDEVNYLPDHGDQGMYTALVDRRGFAQGYSAALSMTPAIIGTTPPSSHCEFAEDQRLRADGGWPMNNLKRAIRGETGPLLRLNSRDVYGYCDGDVPMVVWPVTKMTGWLPTIDVPAGVVTYNGHTGEIVHHEQAPEDLPGPSYPLSVAERQRSTTSAMGSLTDRWFNRVGYEDTRGDADDPNGDNATDMVMLDTDGRVRYVTPATPRGASQSIVALMSVDGRAVSGGLSPLVIHQIENPRVANSTIDGRLRSEHADLPWASGMRVFEVAPGPEADTWVASIGQRQEVTLRADVAADGQITLRDRRGNILHQQDSPTPDDGSDSPSSRPSGDLGQMSADEIREQVDALLDELARRVSENTGG